MRKIRYTRDPGDYAQISSDVEIDADGSVYLAHVTPSEGLIIVKYSLD